MPDKLRSATRLAAGLVALVALALIVSWAVRSLAPVPAAVPTTTPAATQTATPAPFPGTPPARGIYPPSSTPQAAFTPTPNPTQTDTPAEPLLTGANIRTNSWSPDGAWLAYWYSARGDTPDPGSPWPLAELQFTNPASGQTCSHPEVVALSYAPGTWALSGEFLVAEGETYQAGEPCGEFRTLTQAEYAALLPPPAYDPALSTSGTYRAETTILSREAGVIEAQTVFTVTDSGQDVLRLDWARWDALGELGLGGEWLDDATFLVHQSLERGPLLVNLGDPRTVREVAPDLFGVQPEINADPENYTSWAAFGTAAANPEGVYHILLMGTGMEAAFPEILLYHGDSGQVETLPFTQPFGTGFYPSTRPGLDDRPWLMMSKQDFSSGFENPSFYYREIDAQNAHFTLLSDTWYLAWLHDSYTAPDNRLALGWGDGRVRVQTFPGEQVLGEFSTGKFSAVYLDWNPTGDYLAVSGTSRGGVSPYMGLYVFEVP